MAAVAAAAAEATAGSAAAAAAAAVVASAFAVVVVRPTVSVLIDATVPLYVLTQCWHHSSNAVPRNPGDAWPARVS